MPISAVDTITPAIEHTKQQLLRPFRFGQWTRLALVGLLAGEMGSGGGSFNFPSKLHLPSHGGSAHPGFNFPHIDPVALAGILAIIFTAGFVLFLLFLYISSVMRFILFDSIIARECHIRDGWSRRQGPAWKFFLWQIGLMLVTLITTVVLFGIPAGLAFAMGWFNAPKEHLLPLILGGLFLAFLAALFFTALAIVHVLTKDFVIPQMALEGIGAIEAWRRLWSMIRADKGGYAGYIGIKIVLAIVAGILVAIASIFLTLLIALPAAGVVLASILAGKTAGLTWNAGTITAVVVVIAGVFALLMYVVSLISVPVIVFFPAYSIYFFASRYQPLSTLLYSSAPAAVAVPGGLPPQQPPPLPPTPEPIG